MKSVENKVAVITGAASGVGKALALRLAKAGAKIVMADIEEKALSAAADEVRSSGSGVEYKVTDVTKRSEVDVLADFSFEKFSRVDMLFNNAGVSGPGVGAPPIWGQDAKGFHWVTDVNYYGPLHGIQAFLPRMIEQGGESLVTATSSGAGLVYGPNSPAYNASKAALVALMETLHFQLKASHPDIKTAILFPGPHVVDTRLISSTRNMQAEYQSGKADQDVDPAMESATFKQVITDTFGIEMEFTTPDEFAEEVYQSILREDFYILPTEEGFRESVQQRTKAMLERTAPVEIKLI